MMVGIVIAGHEKERFSWSGKNPEFESAVFIVALTNAVTAQVGALSGRQDGSTVVLS